LIHGRFAQVDLAKRPTPDEFARFCQLLEFVRMDLSKPEHYAYLRDKLAQRQVDTVVMYLATAPALFTTICEQLGAAGLNTAHTRVVLEKPLGHDLTSNRAINQAVGSGVYRAPDLPHRPLSGQTFGAEPVCAALWQCAV
jgi:glucose-6-phosphate 1-dehydrogenase